MFHKTVFSFFILMAALLLFSSVAFAYTAYVPNTNTTSQVYAGSYYVPSDYGVGRTYYAYYPNSGYPTLGGGRYYPSGYQSGSYPVYTYPAYAYNPYSYLTYPSTYSSYSSYGYDSYPSSHGTTRSVHVSFPNGLDISYSKGYGHGCGYSAC